MVEVNLEKLLELVQEQNKQFENELETAKKENKFMKEALKNIYRVATTSTDCDVYCSSMDKIAKIIEKLEDEVNEKSSK